MKLRNDSLTIVMGIVAVMFAATAVFEITESNLAQALKLLAVAHALWILLFLRYYTWHRKVKLDRRADIIEETIREAKHTSGQTLRWQLRKRGVVLPVASFYHLMNKLVERKRLTVATEVNRVCGIDYKTFRYTYRNNNETKDL